MNLQGKQVLILGLGESGLAIARWCAREGASFRIADSRREPTHQAAMQAEFPGIGVTDRFEPGLLDQIDLVAISPGLAPHQEPQRGLLERARDRGVPVWGEIEFFAQKLAALKTERGYAPRLIAITGTNGKTTVTRLTANLCRRAGASVCAAGNISPAALEALRLALDADALPGIWVLELSSFQLETTASLKPCAAAILNISQDHLDWHGSLEAYARAKGKILADGAIPVLNRHDPTVMALAPVGSSPLTFGLDAPPAADCFGVVRDAGVRWLAYADSADPEPRSRRSRHAPGAETATKRLMPVEALRIRGDHNASNALAALTLCHAIGLPLAPLLHGLRDYRGEPHRVELIATIAGVEYFDDSKGTNVGATLAAIEGLGRPIVLIAGGDGKGQDFSVLAEPIARHARAVILIGKDANAIRRAIEDAARPAGVELLEAASLEAAVVSAARLAQEGDAVLLSPACASLDMFRNYLHRAEVFASAVAGLALEAPAPC